LRTIPQSPKKDLIGVYSFSSLAKVTKQFRKSNTLLFYYIRYLRKLSLQGAFLKWTYIPYMF
jgi:hypothetical protein